MNDTSSSSSTTSLSEKQREINKDFNLPWNPAVDRSPSPTRRITDYEGDIDHFHTTKHRRNLSQSSIGANALDLLKSGFPEIKTTCGKKLPKIAKDTIAELTQQCATRNLIRQNPDKSCIDFAWRLFLFIDKHPDFVLPILDDAISMIRDLPPGLFPKADYIKGLWYMQGRYCYPFNPDKGQELLNSAAKNGISRAFFHIANYLQTIKKSHDEEIIKTYKRGAQLGDNACAYRLAICYFKGQFGLPFDISKTLHYLEISSYRVDYEFALGAYIYGLLLAGEIADLNGSYGIKKDELKARRLIEHAAIVECAPALLRMGSAYQSETLKCYFDPSISMHYYRIAAEIRSSDAFMELSKWFLVGYPDLFNQNLGKAVKLARISASQGNPEAIFAIGYFYDAGIYLDPSPVKAQEWYHRAARAGNKEASKRLESLTLCGPPALTKLVLPDNRSLSPSQSPNVLIKPSAPNLDKLDVRLSQEMSNIDLESPLGSATPRSRKLPDLPTPNLATPPIDLTSPKRSPTSSLRGQQGYFEQQRKSPITTPSARGYGGLTTPEGAPAALSPRRTVSVPVEEGAKPLAFPSTTDQRQASPVRRSRAIMRHGRTESVPIVGGILERRHELSIEPPVPESSVVSDNKEEAAETPDRPAKSAYSLAVPNLSAVTPTASDNKNNNNDISQVNKSVSNDVDVQQQLSCNGPQTSTIIGNSTLKEKAKKRRSWSPVKRGLRISLAAHSRTMSQQSTTTCEESSSSSCISSSSSSESTAPSNNNTSSSTASSETSASGSEDNGGGGALLKEQQQKYISRTRVIEALDDSARLGPKTFEEMGIPRGVDQKDCIIM